MNQLHLLLVFVFRVLGQHISAFAQITAMGTQELVEQQEDQTAAHHAQQHRHQVTNLFTPVRCLGVGEGLHGWRDELNGQGRDQGTGTKTSHGPDGVVGHRRGDAHNRAQHHGTRCNRAQNGGPHNQCRTHVVHGCLRLGQCPCSARTCAAIASTCSSDMPYLACMFFRCMVSSSVTMPSAKTARISISYMASRRAT